MKMTFVRETNEKKSTTKKEEKRKRRDAHGPKPLCHLSFSRRKSLLGAKKNGSTNMKTWSFI